MKLKWPLIIASILLIQGCVETSDYKALLGVDSLPNAGPIPFKIDLVPKGKLIHRGILNPAWDTYYFTLFDTRFSQFDIYFVERISEKWSESKKASFNSEYNDHGMSFSPDGKTIYFSSTRPVGQKGIASTWHLWRTENINGNWTEPEYVDIPNMRDKLISHPSISENGTLYFHISYLDYSEMDIYFSEYIDGKFSVAKKVFQNADQNNGRCTPFIAPDGSYLMYASINEKLDLMVSFRDDNTGKWKEPHVLPKAINANGQGNPFVTADNGFLFYADEQSNANWCIKWVDIEAFLTKQ